MKKRTFLLFEILIAFFLVALCAVPLVRQPLQFYRSEMKSLEQLERERLADWTFTEIKEKLLKTEIPWKKIPAKGNKSPAFSLPSATIQIPGCRAKQIERTFTLSCTGEKKGLHEEIYRSLLISVDFLPDLFSKKPSHYTYRVIVQKNKLNNN